MLPVLLPAQEASGSLGGRVTDASGAAVTGAEVVALHAETGAVRKTATRTDGSYLFPLLPVGAYQVTVAHPGFKKAVRTGIQLHVSEQAAADVRLEVGELTQEVTVAESAEQVQAESSEQGAVITGEQVTELQLNGRSFMTLLELIPGVASDMPDRADPNTNPSVSINGGRSSSSNFNIDGGNNADVIVGSSALNTFTSVETIAEFKVLTSTFSAEYGRGGFAQVNVVTRSGTRNLHGSLYEFFRNDALDARDYFSHQVLPLKLNNFGWTLGGPLSFPGYNRDRKQTFFFLTQELNRISIRASAVNTTVPTAEERRGDFRALGPGRDGAFGTEDDPVIDPTTGAGFPNGIIPDSRIDPNARKLLDLFPLPNFRGPGAINYTSAAPSQQHWREELVRIDHAFSPNFKVYGRYLQDTADVRNPYGGSGYTSITTRFPGIGATTSDRPGKNFVANLTNVISPALLNQFSLTWSRRLFAMGSVSELAGRGRLGLTIPEIFPENRGNLIPAITLGSGYAALNVPRGGGKQLFVLEFSDNLTRIAGRHLFKTGVFYSYGGNREQPFSPNTNGAFSFSTGFARHPVANLLLGLPLTYSEVEKVIFSDARFAMLEAYLQDDLRVTSRLTLNLGLRWSNYFNPYDLNDMLANFLPHRWEAARAPQMNPANGRPVPGAGDPLNGIVLAGKTSPYGRRVTGNHTHLLGPRFGFAWDLFGKRKTALRGGYGVYYTRPLIGTFINNSFDNPPFSRSVTLQQPSFVELGASEAPASVPNLTALGTPLEAPTVQQWSLGAQHELRRHTVLNVSYVASRGTHLLRPLDINSAEPGAAAARRVHVNTVRPFPGYGSIEQRQSTASSIYHSLQVGLNRRLAGKLTAGLAYTWGKSIDNASSDRNDTDLPPNSRDARAERSPSDSDRTHIFTSSFIWSVPRLARGPLARPGWRPLLDGWQLSGIVRLWTGRTFDVVLTSDVAGIGAIQNQRPDVIASARGPRTLEEWFNRAVFARPASGTFGNMGRNSLRGPGVNKWDLALFKNFRLGEKLRLQFRAEFFNAFNHPSFTNVGRTLFTSAAGVDPSRNNFAVVTDTRDARVAQLA
ncbi:MAG: carboxypeptidase regulatory-like domain-containing protein, partial [Acidobacteriota bacterium]